MFQYVWISHFACGARLMSPSASHLRWLYYVNGRTKRRSTSFFFPYVSRRRRCHRRLRDKCSRQRGWWMSWGFKLVLFIKCIVIRGKPKLTFDRSHTKLEEFHWVLLAKEMMLTSHILLEVMWSWGQMAWLCVAGRLLLMQNWQNRASLIDLDEVDGENNCKERWDVCCQTGMVGSGSEIEKAMHSIKTF